MIKKLREKKGESIAETLYSTLIISLAFLILAGAIISAAGINAKVKNTDYSLDTTYPDGTGHTMQVKIGGENVEVTGFVSDHGYFYYK